MGSETFWQNHIFIDHDDQDNSDSLSRADTLILDDKDSDSFGTSLGKLMTPDKESNGSESRPQTPNPVLAATNVAWHNCRRLIYVPRYN